MTARATIATVLAAMPRDLSIGDRIRRLRGFLGLQQQTLAERAGMDATKLNRIERGLSPSDNDLRKLATALETSIRALRGEAD